MLRAALVVDAGTGSVRAGRAGEDHPTAELPTAVGRPRHRRVMGGGALDGDDAVTGAQLRAHRGALSVARPMDRGLLCAHGGADMERVLRAALAGLAADPREQPLLLTEAALAPRAHRELAAQLVFESLGAPAAHFALPAALTLYAAGATTGLVVDCGEGATSVVPVYEGRVLDAAVQRVELAGRDVTDALRGHLRRAVYDSGAPDCDAWGGSSSGSSGGGGGGADASRAGGGGSHRYYGGALGPSVGSSAELELVRELKEAACFVHPRGGGSGGGGGGGQARASAAAHVGDAPGGDEFYSLPDGQRVRLAREARALSAEVLFAPRALLGSEAPSVPEAVALALGGSPLELREALLASVHVAGGTTCMRGFGQRLLEELRAVTPQGARIRISAPAARAHSAWIGGSIFASLGTFREALVTKAQYDECGAGALAAGSRGHR